MRASTALLLCCIAWTNIVRTKLKTAPTKGTENQPYEIERFVHHPGIYFEIIGNLHQLDSTWKMVIRIDSTSLTNRLEQLRQYLQKTKSMCHFFAVANKDTCQNLYEITKDDYEEINKELIKINSMCESSELRKRGLVDGIGTIAKSLFGTMDSNDEKIINEQLTALHDEQQKAQHAVKNQIKILQQTIAHMDNTEEIIQKNENLLANATKNLREHLITNERQSNIHEHFITINAIVADLNRDIKDTLDYLTTIKQGILHPRLAPIKNIIENLKEASLQLPEGLYFPFRINKNKWFEIEKVITISAYCDTNNIFSILEFPLISHPKYKILNIISLPVPESENIATIIKIKNPLIAISSEQRAYITLSHNDLQACKLTNTDYLCKQNFQIQKINNNPICEVNIYIENKIQKENCEIKQIITSNIMWIPLKNPHAWLYSSPTKQYININCKDHGQIKQEIENTGKIKLRNNCEIISHEIILKSPKVMNETRIESYLPEYNISLPRDNVNISQAIQIQKINTKHSELKNLQTELQELNDDMNKNNNTYFQSKHFIYPMATSGSTMIIVTIIVISLIIYVIRKKKRSNSEKRVTIELKDNDEPKSIFKRNRSARF
ncbi:uncharacterized protein LOC113003882 [Solenopsis invicta]|uniref:uncharacterized protein LOC113003882 n=1 Tax=Solenopsis invicta TaxID=13686 RepID=UPI00193D4CAD|nr:uncharacterized protein LOC113003882 [Solenopsis invicta]